MQEPAPIIAVEFVVALQFINPNYVLFPLHILPTLKAV